MNDKKIIIEIIVPDDAGNDVHDIIHEAREIFHNNFSGSEDYINDNVVVWDNRSSNPEDGKNFDQTGLVVDFKNCKDRSTVANRFMEAITDLIDCPEYIGMIFGKDAQKKATVGKAAVTFKITVPHDEGLMFLIDKTIHDMNDPEEELDSVFTDTSKEDGNASENVGANYYLTLESDLTTSKNPRASALQLINELQSILNLKGMPLYDNTTYPDRESVSQKIIELRKYVKKAMSLTTDDDSKNILHEITVKLKAIANTIYYNEPDPFDEG